MAYIVCSTNRAKRVAKDLKAALSSRGHRKSYLACLDLASQFYGFQSYKALEVGVAARKEPASLDDELAGPAETKARRAFHVAVLLSEGLKQSFAEGVVDEVRPTGRAITPPKEGLTPTMPAYSDIASSAVAALTGIGDADAAPARAEGRMTVGFYIVEEDGTLSPVSVARMNRLMQRAEAMPERSGKEFRFVDAYFLREGREATRLSHCIGLFREFDDSGKLVCKLAEAMQLVASGQKGRQWQVGVGETGQVLRHLKIID